MKKVIILFLVLCSSFCWAQSSWKKMSDSLAMLSRAKADKVLIYFDTLKSPKLLYSVLDKNYYVLIKDEKE